MKAQQGTARAGGPPRCRKIRYPTRAEARLHARRVLNQDGPKGRAYACDLCGGWHITTKLSAAVSRAIDRRKGRRGRAA